MSQRCLVVVPALNEEDAVGAVISDVKAVDPQAHIVVVDDGSTDRTSDVAKAAGADVISLPFNIGVGGALRAGFRYARRFGYQVVVQVDGDGQHNPEHIPDLLAALEGADVVIGARFAGVGDYQVRGARKLAMQLLARSLSRRTGERLTDTTSGFRAFNRRAVEVFANDYPAEYLGDTVEALVIASRAGLRVTQVPVEMRPRTTGTPSHRSLKSTIYLGRVFLALAMSRIRR
ncbi:MAG TPA: glycosyltransferase family 2 protein [Mycobacteriales bacterium]|nr:glycosyltransferase family 2 protein [Mycobacteriales bacterium]